MVEFRRRLYKRGSSFETTMPLPLLFSLSSDKKYDVVFNYDARLGRWYINFEERQEKQKAVKNKKRSR